MACRHGAVCVSQRAGGDAMSGAASDDIQVPVSVGELIDKITILEIKSERIANPAQLANVRCELAALQAVCRNHGLDRSPLLKQVSALKGVNLKIWDVEDAIRECEARGAFTDRFIDLARSIYRLNDERARIKKAINLASGSRYIEEKSYAS